MKMLCAAGAVVTLKYSAPTTMREAGAANVFTRRVAVAPCWVIFSEYVPERFTVESQVMSPGVATEVPIPPPLIVPAAKGAMPYSNPSMTMRVGTAI